MIPAGVLSNGSCMAAEPVGGMVTGRDLSADAQSVHWHDSCSDSLKAVTPLESRSAEIRATYQAASSDGFGSTHDVTGGRCDGIGKSGRDIGAKHHDAGCGAHVRIGVGIGVGALSRPALFCDRSSGPGWPPRRPERP